MSLTSNQLGKSAPLSRARHSEAKIEPFSRPSLSRFLVRAAADAGFRGVRLELEGMRAVKAANLANRDSWKPLIGALDWDNGGMNDTNSFALIGRNGKGEIVAVNAARLYRWHKTNCSDEFASLRAFYGHAAKAKAKHETCTVSAAAAAEISGRVVYSGAAWYRPDFRGKNLSAILPRMTKAIALERWAPDFIISLMTEHVYARGFLKQVGYTNVEWAVQLDNSPLGNARLALLWMTRDDAKVHISQYSSKILS